MQFLDLTNILEPQIAPKSKCGDRDPDTQIHDDVDAVAVSLQGSFESIPRNKPANGSNAGINNNIRLDVDHVHAVLELTAKPITEDGICSWKRYGGAHVLTEQNYGHGCGNLWCWDNILYGDIGLLHMLDDDFHNIRGTYTRGH